ncbi:hypothetical protein [Streptosporangium carneum]|uniref:Uncharacterized protein n=1 Tax=Streptosporangium carneum TaxID=47481 RepID=A0A9W6MB71_9ACTN|nr:hypothetical protein [Streptosporangium carneum]GLK07348.1 hypothetical protein GCM10017600_07530 [Streptosporangium carneum]
MIGRPSRAPGRHRDGQAIVSEVYRRLWDGPAREQAKQLDEKWPEWTVFYSLGNRRFYAVAGWSAPQPVLVESDTAEGLEALMYEEEMARVARGEAPPPAPVSPPPPSRRGGILSQAHAAAPQPSRHPYRRVA